MIIVEERKSGAFMVSMDTPERCVVRKIASAYSISNHAAMTAIINRGMDSIGKQVAKAADPRVPDSEPGQANDYGGD